MTNLSRSHRPSGKCNRGDRHGDVSECVNLASTRWINAIIGRTWGGENPFKARKAKQGPWLIHLANLRVMYECQGALVRLWGAGFCREKVEEVGGGWMQRFPTVPVDSPWVGRQCSAPPGAPAVIH